MKIKKAIIPAAGFGTRFLPSSKAIPKEMFPILDKPAIQYVVEEALESGIEEILIIINRGKTSIENHFDVSYELSDFLIKKEKYNYFNKIKNISNLKNIYFIRQKYTKGLGNAILCGKSFVKKDPFAVLLPDDLFYSEKESCLKQLMNQFKKLKSSIFSLIEVSKKDIEKYGIINGENINNKLYLVKNLIEKPKIHETKSNLAIVGRYIFTSKIFEMIEKTLPDKNEEIQLTDAMKLLIEYEKLYGYIFKGKRYDTGYLLGYFNTIIDFGLRRNEIKEEIIKILKNKIKKNI